MKKKTGAIVTSVAAIALSTSLIVGTTYALFTSESSVNIAVTSAKVNVEATVAEDSIYTKQLYDTDYTYGKDRLFDGEVELDGKTLSVTNFAAGDGVKFNINVVNNGTVSAKYRTVLSSETGLGELEATFGGADGVYGGTAVYSNWAEIEVGVETSVAVTLELPEGATEQNVTYSIIFAVEAVQGNANVVNESDVEADLYIYSKADLYAFAESVNGGNNYAGKTVALMNNVDLNNEAWTPIGTWANPFCGIFDGLGMTVSNLSVDIKGDYAGLFGCIKSATLKNVTVNNANVKGNKLVGAIVGDGYTGTIDNCHVTGDVHVEGHYDVGGLMGYGYANINNCSVKANAGSTVTGVYLEENLEGDNIGGLVGYLPEDTDSFDNFTVSGLTVSGTRKVGGLFGSIGVKERTMSNITIDNVTVVCNADESYQSGNVGKLYIGGVIGEGVTGPGTLTLTGSVTNVTLHGVDEATTGYICGGTRSSTVKFNVEAVETDN